MDVSSAAQVSILTSLASSAEPFQHGKSLRYMFGGQELRRENVANDSLPIDQIGGTSREDAQSLGNSITLADHPPAVAQEHEGQAETARRTVRAIGRSRC